MTEPLTKEQMRGVLVAAAWPAIEIDNGLCISWEESRWVPDAHNAADPYGGSWGPFMINGWWATGGVAASFPMGRYDLRRTADLVYNARYALCILLHGGRGWGSWSTAALCGLVTRGTP